MFAFSIEAWQWTRATTEVVTKYRRNIFYNQIYVEGTVR